MKGKRRMNPHLLVSIDDGIARLTFNRPDVRNALSPEMLDGLLAFFLRAETDRGIRCIVIAGAGSHFMAGGDVKSFAATAQQSPSERRLAFEARVNKGSHVFAVMERLPQPILASISGAVAGAGLGFVGAADLVIAADNASFVMAYVNIGASPDASTSFHLPRAIGVKRAKTMALMGRPIDAKTALNYGLIDWVVGEDALLGETERIARTLAAGPSVAMAQAKFLMNQSLNNTLPEQLAAETIGMGLSAATEDFIEGPKAFLEKRKPQFTGR